MGKKSSTPPDVVGAAATEGKYSRETARDVTYADRPDQVNPLGSVRWSTAQDIDPATGKKVTRWTQNQEYDPRIGGMMDSSLDRASEGMMNNPDWDQFGDVVGFDPEAQRAAAEQASYQKQTARMDPRFEREREQTEIRLRNQGLRPGDQAYDAEMSNFGQNKNDAYEQARLGSTAEGRDEFGIALEGNEKANALRDKQIEEYLAKRGYGLTEVERLNKLVSGEQ